LQGDHGSVPQREDLREHVRCAVQSLDHGPAYPRPGHGVLIGGGAMS
jgi:hypothetical protein